MTILKSKYIWEQFNGLDTNLIYKMENYHINPYLEEPKQILEIKKNEPV